MTLVARMRAHSLPAATALTAAILSIGIAGNAHATVISANSSAFGESVNLTVTPLIGATATIGSGPLPQVSGSVASASVTDVLSTGILTVNASSNVDGNPGARNAHGDATVNNLAIGSLGGLLSLSATTISSTADVNGDFGALTATGTTTIVGLVINGVPLLVTNPVANDVLLNALGIEIIANRQIITGDGATNEAITDDALFISFTNVLGTLGGTTGLINGEIIIGQSQAAMAAAAGGGGGGSVPEPSSLMVLAAGLALFGMSRWTMGRSGWQSSIGSPAA